MTAQLSATPSVGQVSVSALDAREMPRHRWYFFKEAFSPEIVRAAIRTFEPDTIGRIVDPFSGSGTVPLESAAGGYPAMGFEVNPFLAFVANTKLIQCDVPNFEDGIDAAIKGSRRPKKSPLAGFSTFSKAKGIDKWLFNPSVLEAFEGAWARSLNQAELSPAQRLVKLCLIGAAMDCSNAYKDGKCLRYRKNWKGLAFDASDFAAAIEARGKIISSDLAAAPICPDGQHFIKLADSRRKVFPSRFTLCVTSPPYLNSFDYTDVYRPELFLGRWVTTMAELRALRLQTVRSHLQVKWKDPKTSDFGARYTDAQAKLRKPKGTLWNNRIPLMVQAYFEDMRAVLANLKKRANETASVWIVVSTSAYAGVEIPVDLILADIAGKAGWYLREVSVLRNLDRISGQQWSELSDGDSRPYLRESLIVLDSRPRS
jgi:hypothetical protein